MCKSPTPNVLLVAIRAKCLDCSGKSITEVKRCKIRDCPLWQYRIKEAQDRPKPAKGQVNIFDYMKEARA